MSSALPLPVAGSTRTLWSFVGARGGAYRRRIHRRYFRASAQGESLVLAVYSAPVDPRTLPFVNVAELFAAVLVPVPRIVEAGDLGVLALEDLGDVTLQAHVGAGRPTHAGALPAGRRVHRRASAAGRGARRFTFCRAASRRRRQAHLGVRLLYQALPGGTAAWPRAGGTRALRAEFSAIVDELAPSRVCSVIATTTAAI